MTLFTSLARAYDMFIPLSFFIRKLSLFVFLLKIGSEMRSLTLAQALAKQETQTENEKKDRVNSTPRVQLTHTLHKRE